MHSELPRSTRALLAGGTTADQLRSRRWHAPFRGVHVLASAPCDLLSRCRALVEVARTETVVSDLTAARLYGWWLPALAEEPLHITVQPRSVVNRPGVVCHRRQLAPCEVRVWQGTRLTSPLRTLVDLSRQLCLIDLVVVVDSALQLEHCSIEELRDCASSRGARGIRLLRQALALVDGRSESPMESLMRLAIVLSGLPAPISQAVIRDEHGVFVARGDLKPPEVAAVFEYDGAVHNDPSQHARDVSRWRALRAAGYEVFPYTARDLFPTPHRIITDYQRVLGLPVDVMAIRGWLVEWGESGWRNQPGFAERRPTQ